VHDGGQVLAGIRLTPTTARWGIYSYMIRDAQVGPLATIPDKLLIGQAPVSPKVWESSRVFIAHDVPSNLRSRVQRDLMTEMVNTAPCFRGPNGCSGFARRSGATGCAGLGSGPRLRALPSRLMAW